MQLKKASKKTTKATEKPAVLGGEIIAGVHPGRLNPEQITIYGGVGLAFQDAVAAWQIYRAALSRGLGREIDFLA